MGKPVNVMILYANMVNLNPGELECIVENVNRFEYPVYIEVGVYFGGTFCKVLNNLKNKKSYKAIGIDLYDLLINESEDLNKQTHQKFRGYDGSLNVAKQDILEKKLIEKGCSGFELVMGYSHEKIAELNCIGDVFFIDGNHTYEQCRLDVESSYLKSKVGTRILLHDSGDSGLSKRYINDCNGGPWKVSEEMKKDDRFKHIKRCNTVNVFEVVKMGE